jgi:KDO2-lipid IV(A) lauroyltransferase
MNAFVYYLFVGVNWVMTLLPLRVLYLFSHVIFFSLYHFPSYRRNIVYTNLKNSFPEKSEKEIREIERKYYHHLSDLFIEVLKLTHMSKKELMRRFTISNEEVLNKLYNEKRDVIAVLGHYNNWEWLTILKEHTSLKTISIYKPLKDKRFEKFLNGLRTKFGMTLTPMSLIIRELLTNRKNKINTISAFISDQSPAKGDITFWTNFLNQDTPVYTGAEKVAAKYDMAVVFFHIQKIKRGHYNLHIDLLFEHTTGLPEHLVTETHVKHLENIIRKNPEYWVWSHRRWKHKRPVDA